MIRLIQEAFPDFHPKTINGCVWKLVDNFPDKVYKPEKGLFKLKSVEQTAQVKQLCCPVAASKSENILKDLKNSIIYIAIKQ